EVERLHRHLVARLLQPAHDVVAGGVVAGRARGAGTAVGLGDLLELLQVLLHTGRGNGPDQRLRVGIGVRRPGRCQREHESEGRDRASDSPADGDAHVASPCVSRDKRDTPESGLIAKLTDLYSRVKSRRRGIRGFCARAPRIAMPYAFRRRPGTRGQRPTSTTSSRRGPCTPSTRSSSMSLVADGPEIQVSGRAGERAAIASGTPGTIRPARTTQTW